MLRITLKIILNMNMITLLSQEIVCNGKLCIDSNNGSNTRGPYNVDHFNIDKIDHGIKALIDSASLSSTWLLTESEIDLMIGCAHQGLHDIEEAVCDFAEFTKGAFREIVEEWPSVDDIVEELEYFVEDILNTKGELEETCVLALRDALHDIVRALPDLSKMSSYIISQGSAIWYPAVTKFDAVVIEISSLWYRIVELNTVNNRAAICLITLLSIYGAALAWLVHWTRKPYQLYSNEHLEYLQDMHKVDANPCEYDFEICDVLGQSAFSSIAIMSRTHKVTQKTSKFAVKVMSENGVPAPGPVPWLNPLSWILRKRNAKRVMKDEVKVMRALLQSAHLAGYAGAKFAQDTVYQFLNLPQGDTLASLLKTCTLDHAQLRMLVLDLICGIQFMHDRGLACGELTPKSILIGNDGHAYIMASDFLTINNRPGFELRGDTPVAVTSPSNKDLGQDWCNLGLLLQEIVTGTKSMTGGRGQVTESKLENLEIDGGRGLASLIKGLVTRQLPCSMSPAELRSHELFAGVDWQAVAAKQYFSPLFLSHDLATCEALFTMDHVDSDTDLDHIVRYLHGIGRYSIRTL